MSDHSRRYTAEHHDHARDLAKHDPRPGERDYVPLRLEPAKIPTALEIALIVKGLADPTKGADLIEQYARTVASEKAVEAVEQAGNRIIAAIGSPLSRREPV